MIEILQIITLNTYLNNIFKREMIQMQNLPTKMSDNLTAFLDAEGLENLRSKFAINLIFLPYFRVFIINICKITTFRVVMDQN